ncbi:MAG: phosphonate lyase system protein PhnL [Pseudomonadota bacterium]|jgi:alpha-D-ribose 1-methylphosphonate 5-triphosphate synthase subunit PhnL
MTNNVIDMIRMRDVSKTFVMHLQKGTRLSVVERVTFEVEKGACVVLGGPSGAGKSSILKMIYANYLPDGGSIEIRGPFGWIDIARAAPRDILRLRQTTMGYVSQFLRTIPRVSALDIVALEAACDGGEETPARAKASELLARLNVPERLWHLPPATFSGGEQQRVNIARGFAAARPILLLDEPTASLDAANRAVVVDLINERLRAGTAILGIFHDQEIRDQVATRVIDVTCFTPKAAP